MPQLGNIEARSSHEDGQIATPGCFNCMHVANSTNVSLLQEAGYIRERWEPRPCDAFYLHLSDLLLALRRYETDLKLKVLDFGCGGSPYRQLFPNAEYLRADLPAVPDLDFHIDAEGRVNAPSGDFDVVLSTQVLEHCPDSAVYLAEARRILRPGGKLLLTTHGVFEDHGCPYDFLRWTADGLERAVANAGFEVRKCQKLTTTGRAIAFLVDRHGGWLMGSRNTFRGFFVRSVRRIVFGRRDRFNRWCDVQFADCRVVDSHEPDHPLYVALLLEAVKTAV